MVITTVKRKKINIHSIERAAWKTDLHQIKIHAFCARLKKEGRKPERSFLKTKGLVRSGWHCSGCNSAFYLKPLTRFKVLLQYQLKCPFCKNIQIANCQSDRPLISASTEKNKTVPAIDSSKMALTFFSNRKNYSIGISSVLLNTEIDINML